MDDKELPKPSGDLYQILGIAQTADQDVIRTAYHRLSLLHHPDKGGDLKTFKKITLAYQVLRDQGKRQEYDNRLSATFEQLRGETRDMEYHEMPSDAVEIQEFNQIFEEQRDEIQRREFETMKNMVASTQEMSTEALLEQRLQERDQPLQPEIPDVPDVPLLNPGKFDVNLFNELFNHAKKLIDERGRHQQGLEEVHEVSSWNTWDNTQRGYGLTHDFRPSDLHMPDSYDMHQFEGFKPSGTDVTKVDKMDEVELRRRMEEYETQTSQLLSDQPPPDPSLGWDPLQDDPLCETTLQSADVTPDLE